MAGTIQQERLDEILALCNKQSPKFDSKNDNLTNKLNHKLNHIQERKSIHSKQHELIQADYNA